MEHIYHEKQDGALCGKHCINNLLQGLYCSEIELATIAQQMDQEEKKCMAEQGTDTSEFRRFAEEPSANMDDSGMFSIQVLTTALKNLDLSLVNYSSTQSLAINAQQSPKDQRAYVCNFKEHWFTIRKIGKQWFNLNSLLTFPELISDTYLALFLKQLQHEGYSIFVVDGIIPQCQADTLLLSHPIVQTIKPSLISARSSQYPSSASSEDPDHDLQAALAASLAKAGVDPGASSSSYPIDKTASERELEKAILLSLGQDTTSSGQASDYDRAMKLSMEASSFSRPEEKDHDLEKALQMSLDSSLCQVEVPENPLEEPDLEELRRKRLEKLCKK